MKDIFLYFQDMSKYNSNNAYRLNNHDFSMTPLQHCFENKNFRTIVYKTLPDIKEMTNRLSF